MMNIIKADLYRIFRGKAIYITIIVMFIFMSLSIVELAPGSVGMNIDPDEESSMALSKEDERALYETDSILEERKIMKKYPYKLDKAIVGANANLYYLFIVVIVIVISTDLSNSTAKNTIASAISRRKYYFSKLICGLLLCTLLILLNNFGTYFVNLLVNGKSFSSNIGTITVITLYQLPIMYGIISLLVCISVLAKKTSIFNTIAIPFLIVCNLILMAIISIFKVSPNIMNFEYQNILVGLASNHSNIYILKSVILGFLYIIVFNLVGYFLLKRIEIK